MKRILLIVLLLGAAAVGYFIYQLKSDGFAINISQSEIQKQIETKFPIERSMLLAKTTFSNPRVQLKDGTDRIHFSADVTATIPTQPGWKGSAEFSGGVKYEPELGEILLQDAQIETLVLQGIPEKYQEQVKEVGSLIAREYLNRFAIYKLDATDYRQSLAKLVLKSVSVKGGKLQIVLGIYDL